MSPLLRWTEQHESILREKYSDLGTNIPELRTIFSSKSIQNKASKLGLCSTRQQYTVHFDGHSLNFREVLRTLDVSTYTFYNMQTQLGLSPQETIDRIASFFIKTPEGFVKCAHVLNLPEEYYIHKDGKRWSISKYVETFEPNIDRQAVSSCMSHLSVTADQALTYVTGDDKIREDIWKSAKGHSRQARRFSKAEDDIILSNSCMSCRELSELLPTRDATSIYHRARALGLKLSLSHDIDAHSLSVRNEELRSVVSAYTGTDDKKYFFCLCSVCGSLLLAPAEVLQTFTHGELCTSFSIDEELVPADKMRTLRRDS